jgi:RNA polymerase sigma-B factor
MTRLSDPIAFATASPAPASPSSEDLDLVRAYRSSSCPHERQALKTRIVDRHTGLVYFLARRFAHKGEPLEDLVQVGMVGLLGALERFDPERGREFATFARPNIVGELKRHFRDKTWAVRVPRGLQELGLEVTAVETELLQELGRSPTAREIADRVGATEEEVLEAIEASRSHTAASLEIPIDDGGTLLADVMGEEAKDLEQSETMMSLLPALSQLSPLERRVLHMRFFKGMVQSQIARHIGTSQMQVSRILARTLERLRFTLE